MPLSNSEVLKAAKRIRQSNPGFAFPLAVLKAFESKGVTPTEKRIAEILREGQRRSTAVRGKRRASS
jgi:hypothetical protein